MARSFDLPPPWPLEMDIRVLPVLTWQNRRLQITLDAFLAPVDRLATRRPRDLQDWFGSYFVTHYVLQVYDLATSGRFIA